MEIKIIEDIDECERLWNKFSPQTIIWDKFEYFKDLLSINGYSAYFVLLHEGDDEIGVLPLWLDKSNNKYYQFGGSWRENFDIWFPEEYIDLLFSVNLRPLKFIDMSLSMKEKIEKNYSKLPEKGFDVDYNYSVDLDKIEHNVDNFFLRFSAKQRKNMKNDLKKVLEYNPEISYGGLEYFDNFTAFNSKRFNSESDYKDDKFKEEALCILKTALRRNELFALHIHINGKLEGIEYALFHNGIYHVFNGGYNREFNNLGKLIMFEHMKNAIKLKANRIDFLVGDTGWKELWKLEKSEVFTIQFD